MSSYQIQLPSQAVHVAFAQYADALAVLLSDGVVQVWDLHTRLPGSKGSRLRGGGKVAEPALRWEGRIQEGKGIAKQVCMDNEGKVAVLGSGSESARGWLVRLEEGKQVGLIELDEEAERILWEESMKWAILDKRGSILQCE